VTVELVFSERRSELTDERAANYARLQAELEAASGDEVRTRFYEEGGELEGPIVLSGSSAPWAAHDTGALDAFTSAMRATRQPALGICAGMQLLVLFGGGTVGPGTEERGFGPVTVRDDSDLLRGLSDEIVVFHDHSDEVVAVPDGFRVLASSEACAVQAVAAPARRWWGTQFHPEESGDVGRTILRTFFALCART
jgi:GMP synthase (glutamine-hydrolysing)